MSWVKLDDGFADNVKILRAGADALALWVCGLAYCNRQPARDGFIPAEKVAHLYPVKQAAKASARLVEVGLWESSDGGYRVHDYHEFQLDAVRAAALREKRAEAGRVGGHRSGETRREAPAKQIASVDASALLPESKQLDEANPNPVPVPVPLPEERSSLRSLSRASRAQRATRWPEDFTLTEKRADWARQGSLDPEQEFAHFRDHHLAKGSRFVDWDAAWRKWCRMAFDIAQQRQQRAFGAR